jgi:phosphoenolpyruvate carboxylase
MQQVAAFDLHIATLDLRQHSNRHTEALAEITRGFGLTPDYSQMDEGARVEWLTSELLTTRPLVSPETTFSKETTETLNVFRVARRAIDEIGPHCIGTYIISMTRDVSDMLAVLLLSKQAGLFARETTADPEPEPASQRSAHRILVAPLFETIDDLRRAPLVMKRLFENRAYQAQLKVHDHIQEIMIGYSELGAIPGSGKALAGGARVWD